MTMRTRKLLAALALVLLGAFAVAGPAGAQDEHTGESGEVGTSEESESTEEEGEHDISHAAEECIHELEDGGEPEDCHDAPSPILPATNELIWGGITFLVLLIGMWKLGLPAVKNMMDTRTERIRAEVDAADAAKAEADRIRQEYGAQLADAKGEAARIIEEARQAADKLRQDLKRQAEAEVAEIKERAQEDIAAQVERAMGDLRARVADMTIELTEKVVQRNLDRETNLALIERFIDEAESAA